jgi:xanthine dehydrogenase accessory factor
MRELRDILASLVELRARGEPAALATITRVRGSTYRRQGARLLIRADGSTVGSISGGCLEGDVAEAAREVMQTGRPRLLNYDLTADDDAVWGLGLGCNGAIDVFVEPVRPDSGGLDLVAVLSDTIDRRRTAALATVIGGADGARVGGRLYVPSDGAAVGSLGDARADEAAAAAARRQMRARQTAVVPIETGDGAADLFVEVLAPPLPLLVCGAGHDARPLVRLAHELGWRVMVADSRPAFATPDRFPEADEVVRADDADVAKAVRIDADTFAVVMTHNFLHDLEILRGLLSTPARYIGLLGPRARTEKLLAELAARGVVLDDAQRVRLYAPVGLDTGADSPEEIAVSILAEILAVRNGRGAASLRTRRGPIHAEAPGAGAASAGGA